MPVRTLSLQGLVGLSGFLGHTLHFQEVFSASDQAVVVDWFSATACPQCFIACWELLAQLALVWVIYPLLQSNHWHALNPKPNITLYNPNMTPITALLRGAACIMSLKP